MGALVKCPCCGHQSDKDILVHGDRVLFKDGTEIKLELGVAKLLGALLVRPVRMLPGDLSKQNIPVYVSKLRKIIDELGLPYRIIRRRGEDYRLVKLNEQDYHPPQRSQDVHS